jgi:cell division protein FtsZ
MGGGTGTGAAPVIARAVRELGILTVGVVTKPFHFEGDRRMELADRGIEELQNFVDTLIIIPNQNLFRVANERTTFAQAFSMADDVLHSGVRGITDLIVMPGLINRDFADIKTVMSEMGKAMMGTGEMDGDNRALRAAEAAISNPLLDEVSMKGARAVLVNVTGGSDLMLFEVDEAVNRIRAEVEADSNILFGSAISDTMEGRVRVSVVATGIGAGATLNGLDNVEHLWTHKPKAALAMEADFSPEADDSQDADAVDNPVHAQVERLEKDLAADADPLEAAVKGAPALAAKTEPMLLGGENAPMMAEPVNSEGAEAKGLTPQNMVSQSLDNAVARPEPEHERRGFSRLFGGRRKITPESEEKHEHVTQVDQTDLNPIASTQTIGVQIKATPLPVEPVAPRVSVTKQESPAAAFDSLEEVQPEGSSDSDLFEESNEDKRADIPAFLRAQDISDDDDDKDPFEIPSFLRRQAGSCT